MCGFYLLTNTPSLPHWMQCAFLSWLLKFPPSLVFCNLNMMCLAGEVYVDPVEGSLSFLDLWIYHFLKTKLGSFRVLFLQISFFPFSALLASCNSSGISDLLTWAPGQRVCVISLQPFSVRASLWTVSISHLQFPDLFCGV